MKKIRSYGFDDTNHTVHNTIIDLTSPGRTDEESAAFVRMFLSRLAIEHPDLAWPFYEETRH
jgi:hypothetical protein